MYFFSPVHFQTRHRPWLSIAQLVLKSWQQGWAKPSKSGVVDTETILGYTNTIPIYLQTKRDPVHAMELHHFNRQNLQQKRSLTH